MRDKSGAQRAPAGSGLGITPADSGGKATQQRAPGHERPPATQRAAGHGRLSAASGAPGPDVPLATTAGAPGHDRLSAVQQAPGPDVPLATTARAPRHDRLSAAHLVPDHNRSGAALAAASVPDRSHVSPPPVSAHDRSRRAPVAAGSPPASVTHPATLEETVYDRLFTADEVQALLQAATAPVLDGEIRVLQVLIRRGPGHFPRPVAIPQPAAGRRRPALAAHRPAATNRCRRPRRRRVTAPAQGTAGARQGLPLRAVSATR